MYFQGRVDGAAKACNLALMMREFTADWHTLTASQWCDAVVRPIAATAPQTRRAVMAYEPTLEELEHRRQLAPDGPLHHLPFLVKDIFDVMGWPTTASSQFLADERPVRQSAALVERLEQASAVAVGKTHLNEFAYGLSGENCHFGDCPHPWLQGVLSGGSSSGSAYAVAKNWVPFSLGTDTGGSIRVPASFCGIWGLRYTPGFLTDGCFPLAASFDTVGFFSADVHLLKNLHTCVAGSDSLASEHAAEPVRIFAHLPEKLLTAELYGALDKAIESHGIRPHTSLGQEWDAWVNKGLATAFTVLQSTEAYQLHEKWIQKYKPLYDPQTLARLLMGSQWTPQQFQSAQSLRSEFSQWLEDLWAECDVFVLPAVPQHAPQADELNQSFRSRLLDLTSMASIAGLPVVTEPVRYGEHFSGGLQYICRDISVMQRLLNTLSEKYALRQIT